MIIFLSKDIFFWPVVKAAAADINSPVLIISKVDDAKLAEVESGVVKVLLIDLAAIEVSSLETVVSEMRLKLRPAKIIAFGSHVHQTRLASAEQAGCDLVLSRGQFSSNPESYLLGS